MLAFDREARDRRHLAEVARECGATDVYIGTFDREARDRRLAEVARECGATDGYIGKVTLGPAITDAQVPRRVRTVTVQAGRPMPPPRGGCSRPRPKHERVEPSPVEAALLDTIYGYHVQALAAMSRETVGRDARGMVLAGYAYGRHNPVINIIYNALWYDARFSPPPSREEVQVKMLTCKALFRLARRSLDALLAFMTTYAPALSTADALAYLSRTRGDLYGAIEQVHIQGIKNAGKTDDAFRAAIIAAHLPNEAARKASYSFVVDDYHFVPEQQLLSKAYEALHPNPCDQLPYIPIQPRSDAYEAFLRRAMRGSKATVTPSSSNISPGAYRAFRLNIHFFKMEEMLSHMIVQKALEKLASQFGKPYELHMICGKSRVTLPPNTYYHVNFLAYEDGHNTPTLFFAEVSATLRDVTLCCALSLPEGIGGCSACEFNGMKLIHPAEKVFNGQLDFTKGEDPEMIERFRRDPTSEFGTPLMEDYIFFELDKHPEVASFLDTTYSNISDDQIDLSFMWFEDYLP